MTQTLGRGRARLGDNHSALAALNSALRLSEGKPWTWMRSNVLLNLANVYDAMGNSSKALEIALKNISELEANGLTRNIPAQWINIGNLYRAQNRDDLALDYYQRAFKAFEPARSPVGRSYALAGIGAIYIDQGRIDEGLEYIERSRKLKTQFMEKDPGSISSIARAHHLRGNYKEALRNYQESLNIYEEQGWSFLVPTLDSIAEVHYLNRDYVHSLDAAKRAIDIAEKFNYDQAWRSYSIAGQALLALERKAEARRYLETSIAKVEIVRTNSLHGDSLERSFQNMVGPYQSLVELAAKESDAVNALHLSERLKARALLDALQVNKLDLETSLSAAAFERVRNFRKEIAQLNSLVSREKDRKRVEEINRELSNNRVAMEKFFTELYASNPELRIQRGQLDPIKLSETSPLLDTGRNLLVELVVSKEQSFLITISRNLSGPPIARVNTIRVKQETLISEINRFRSKLATGDLDFQKVSRELYDLLLKPIEKELAGKMNIIIVPDGPLWDLPFQALQDENGKYLIEKAAVSYAPSLTALREMQKKARSRKPSPDAELLAFGNPIVGSATKERVQRVFMSEKLEPIPEAERLVKELGKMYGPKRSKVFIGADAREEVAKTESPKYRIVQFATHGILNNVSPMYSQLVLAQNAKNSDEDGLLEAWELKDLDLKADMVILTACETARGRIAGGEGMIGMTWAAFIAGAPTTVASQWKVESSSTTELMLEFHRQLLSKKPPSKAEALRRASLKLMKMPKYRHPSYWAGFVIVGDAS